MQYPTDIGAALFEQERKRTGGLIDVAVQPNDNLDLDLPGFYSKLEAAELQPQLPAVEHALHQLRAPARRPDPGYVVKDNTLDQGDLLAGAGARCTASTTRSRARTKRRPPTTCNFDGNFRFTERMSTLFAQAGTS